MIKIGDEVIKNQKKFWNQCVFHPTDAIEDPWGRRILDRMSKDKAIDTVRVYTMFEDIVYIGEDGDICYDFRLSDLRLDFLVEKGYKLLLAYAGIPDCIASSTNGMTSVSKNKTRYKGKMWNSAPPKDFAVWEEICYEYTKHIIERYGIETVSKWRMHCFNEPDIPQFFFSNEYYDREAMAKHRLPAYCELYKGFERGIRRASERLEIGGPALALDYEFLDKWLEYVKENNLKLDFISVHNYGTTPHKLNSGEKPYNTHDIIDKHLHIVDIINARGFGHLPLVVDEWGMATCGFYNVEECPKFIDRETEVFSSYFIKLIYDFVHDNINIDQLMICLSGQHEMVTDFSGFRNFFTLNFIAKPIYNAYLMSSRLFTNFLKCEGSDENTFVLPTSDKNGSYSIMLTYCSKNFKEDIPVKGETLILPDEVRDKKITVFCIDKKTTNPYRLYQRNSYGDNMSEEEIKILREEGKIKPIKEFTAENNTLSLELTPNCVYLITAE